MVVRLSCLKCWNEIDSERPDVEGKDEGNDPFDYRRISITALIVEDPKCWSR